MAAFDANPRPRFKEPYIRAETPGLPTGHDCWAALVNLSEITTSARVTVCRRSQRACPTLRTGARVSGILLRRKPASLQLSGP